MGNTDPKDTKAGKEIRGQASDLGIRSWKTWGGHRLMRGWLDPLAEPKGVHGVSRVHVASCEPSCELVHPWFETWLGPWLGLDLRKVLPEWLRPRVAGGGGQKGASCGSRVGGGGGD
ncbi:hypothetical protein F511_30548 [Dorcoceras hygrometricum]|uniref:Uncharacterized protein n=1 Tax=Dorcoceras hygrometricum TaxID=472368 RepID=A0A2Z7DCP5_9LAMI|nr:hypothetical protein F511_30548 [Dorcoceras hygrometricum]